MDESGYYFQNFIEIDNVIIYGNKVKNLSIIYKFLFDNTTNNLTKLKIKEKMNSFITDLNVKSSNVKSKINKIIDDIITNILINDKWDISEHICSYNLLINKLELLKSYEFLTIESIYD